MRLIPAFFLSATLTALAAPAQAQVFCYYLIAEDGAIQTYKTPPLDLSYDPDNPAATLPTPAGHLVIAQVDRCRSQVRPRQDVATPPAPPAGN